MYDIKNCSDLTILASRVNVNDIDFDHDLVMVSYDTGLLLCFTNTVIRHNNIDLAGILFLEPGLSGLDYELKELYLVILDSKDIKDYLFTVFKSTDDILQYIQNNIFNHSSGFNSDVSVCDNSDFAGWLEMIRLKIKKNKRLDDKLVGLVDASLKNIIGSD